jgi:hypothetical protein
MRVEGTMDVSRATWRKSPYSGTETNCVEIAVVRQPTAGDDLISGDYCS